MKTAQVNERFAGGGFVESLHSVIIILPSAVFCLSYAHDVGMECISYGHVLGFADLARPGLVPL